MMKAVIFDMDGVIFDTERVWQEAFIMVNEKYNVNLTEEWRKSICGKSEELIRKELKEMMPNLDVDKYRDEKVAYVNDRVFNGYVPMKDGFLELVKKLKEKNYKILLATSSHRLRALTLFSHHNINIDEIFDGYVFGEDVKERSKPDPYIFNLARSKVGLEASECYVIEDSINGIEAATKGGFKPIMVIDLIEPNDYCKKNCFKIFNSLKEVLDII